ncbi:MAG: VCBS repeat-containing protein [Candidatus Hydrogenedentes bacterium]|nr:VCBS repeat-containing protein [Candidatus Hydrogenedentota bacterium]
MPFRRIAVATLLTALVAPAVQADLFGMHPRRFKVGPNPSSIAAADLDEDGNPEVVTADRGELNDLREERPGNDELSLLLAQGNLEYIKLHPSLKTGFGPYAVAIANIDALRWPDIVVANFHDSRARDISLFLNLQEEHVFEPYTFTIPTDGMGYYRQNDGDAMPLFDTPGLTSIAVRDVNGDSFRDLLATGWSSDCLVYMPGKNETHFGEPVIMPCPGGPVDLKLADLDGDGAHDIVVANSASGEVGLWKGSGAGAFEEVARFPTRGTLPRRVAVADMNNDGQADIVVTHRHTDDSVVIFYGDGKFAFSISQELVLGKDRQLLEHEIQDLAVADFSLDGLPDIAVACYASATVQVYIAREKSGATMVYNHETYTFKEGRPRALTDHDLNSDGKPDIAVALWETDEVAFLINKTK